MQKNLSITLEQDIYDGLAVPSLAAPRGLAGAEGNRERRLHHE